MPIYDKDQAAGIRPEDKLLLCCARTILESDRVERIRDLLREDIDWTYLIRTALSHGMIALLYWSLNNTCPEAVPRAILDQLRGYFHDNARRNLILTGELLKLLKLFEVHGIPAISYKGPVLAASAYGDLALRHFYDLDILVHERDVLKAKNLLISRGYRQTGVQEAVHLQPHCEYGFVRDDGRAIVELRWRITSHRQIPSRHFSFSLDRGRLWERLEPVSLGGREILTLSPEDLLLIFCLHGAKHLWERLGWICDVAKLIGVHQGMDWEEVMRRARSLGSGRMLFLGLFLASDLLGAALPEEVWQRVQADPVVKSLATQVRQRLFREANDSPGIFESSLFYLRARDSLQDRVMYCLYLVHFAITPNMKDQAFLPLPAFLSFLYYPLRPIRLIGKYGLNPLKHLLGF